MKWINLNAAAFAAQEGISEAEAVRRLTAEGAARVDAKVARLVGIENVDLEATEFLSKMGGKYGFTATEAEFNNFNLYGKDLLKSDALYRQVFNSLLASGVSKDNLKYTFFNLNNLRGDSLRSQKGVAVLQASAAVAGQVPLLLPSEVLGAC